MFIIPYRVKNPWKHFPIATVCLIALNVIIFFITVDEHLVIRESIVENYANQLGVSGFFTIFSSMFLHEGFMHIAGNMLFFWVFAPSVEDRLGIPRFLLLYFATGIIGDLLQGVLDSGMLGHAVPGIGASGCIMGVMGAYWYLYPWSKVCLFYWIIIKPGVWEVTALWVMGFYLVTNLVDGFMNGVAGGVANFAHLGGLGSGVLFCLALRMKRDTGQVSEAKAVQAEVKHLEFLPLAELEVLHRDDPQNAEILRAMIQPALCKGRSDHLLRAFEDVGPSLVSADPDLAVWYLLKLHGDPALYGPAQLLRIGRHSEGTPEPAEAIDIYAMVMQHFPQAPENEMALYRMALTYREHLRDTDNARVCLQELLQRYPFGSLEAHARQLLQQIGEHQSV